MNEFLFKLGLQWEWVGSVAINGEGDDMDLAIRVDEVDKAMALDYYQALGWLPHPAAYDENVPGRNFKSLKKGDFNILLCYDDVTWTRFVKGRDLCIFLKGMGVDMSRKDIRIAIHEIAAGGSEAQVRASVARLGLLQLLQA